MNRTSGMNTARNVASGIHPGIFQALAWQRIRRSIWDPTRTHLHSRSRRGFICLKAKGLKVLAARGQPFDAWGQTRNKCSG